MLLSNRHNLCIFSIYNIVGARIPSKSIQLESNWYNFNYCSIYFLTSGRIGSILSYN